MVAIKRNLNMNKMKKLSALTITLSFLAAPLAGFAADEKAAAAKPYPLDHCVVSGEKLGEMGAPYVFTYQGREIKMCCKGCLKDFKKDPAAYIKKLEQAEAKVKK